MTDEPTTDVSDAVIPNYPKPSITLIHSAEIGELSLAMSIAQGQMENAAKDTKNPFFDTNYADLASCRNATKQPLADNKLALMQFPSSEHGTATVETILSHSSGQWIRSTLVLPVVREKKGVGFVEADDPQAVGSAISYARRYALAAICGIAQEDDDGNAASGAGRAQKGNKADKQEGKRQGKESFGANTTQPKEPAKVWAWSTATSAERRDYTISRIRTIRQGSDPIQSIESLKTLMGKLKPSDLNEEDSKTVVEAIMRAEQDIIAECSAA